MKTVSIILLTLVLIIVSSISVFAQKEKSLPDLFVVGTTFRTTGPPSFSGENILVPVELRIQNSNWGGPAGPFQLSIMLQFPPPAAPMETELEFRGTRTFPGLEPGRAINVSGQVIFPKSESGKKVKIHAIVDSMAQVHESNEGNNVSPWLEIQLPLEIRGTGPAPVSPPGLPDLTIWIGLRGLPTIVRDKIEIPFKVTVQNMGKNDAGIFKVSAEYEIISGGRPGLLTRGGIPFTVPGQSNVWYPVTRNPLPSGTPPRSQVTFDGKLIFDKAFGGTQVRIRAIADSTAGDDSMPAYGRVRESNEENNATPWDVVNLPGAPDITYEGRPEIRGASWGTESDVPELRNKFWVGCTYRYKNIGQIEFEDTTISAEYEIVSGGKPGIATRGRVSFREGNDRLPGIIPADGVVSMTPGLLFPPEFEGAGIRIRVMLDPDHRVREWDETNNTTPWSNVVTFPPIRR